MTNSAHSFQEFERARWDDPGVVVECDENLSDVTTQSIEAPFPLQISRRLRRVGAGGTRHCGQTMTLSPTMEAGWPRL
jgi:hypothetical protein